MIPDYDTVAEMRRVRIQFDGNLPTTGTIGITGDDSIYVLYDDQIFPNLEKLFDSDHTLYADDLTLLEEIED
ncbi:hypothetical protein [Bifidobacterium sp. SO1]|uniref:hypothetical protein n=1 Tax=Bifidobacterium sp. SO1 TaxID=2809029 RepID=UPI001BDCED38|nr:hypothetical protein [Bifidobacterium sp. SO1]MBT1162198.1 hypothetical protein [Bifidobacterium sp. SO1]